jgi:8-amino-7-oxononanoate synthase
MHRWAMQPWRRSLLDRPGARSIPSSAVPAPATTGIPPPRAIWPDLARLQAGHPMSDAVIDEIDGRRIRVGAQWLADFASCNYLGFDLEPEIIQAVPEYLARWGTHPSWSRLLGSPRVYEEIETELAGLLGAEDTLLLPTITLIHMSVIPVLAANGAVFLDARAHKTIYDACVSASGQGATLVRFHHDDPDHLEQLLRTCDRSPRLICLDGVNSMTGNIPPLADFARVAREYDAQLYVDDAHGFGLIGERGPGELCDYGSRGNSVVRYADETYQNLILVGGFSKAYSSMLAFIACPPSLKQVLKVAAPPYLYSGPVPVASLATAQVGLKVNAERGDAIRADLHRKTARVLDGLHQLNIATPNRSGIPVIEVPLANPEDIDAVGRYLFNHGIYVTLAAYPLVPRSQVGFRIQTTAANTDEEITHLLEVLGDVAGRFQLQARQQLGVCRNAGRPPPSTRTWGKAAQRTVTLVWKIVLSGLGFVIMMPTRVNYLRRLFQRRVATHAMTWVIWGVLGGIAFAAQIHGGGAALFYTGSATAFCFVVAFVSLIQGDREITRSDWLTLFACIVTASLWAIFETPLWSVCAATIIDVLGYLPAGRKAWVRPHNEGLLIFVIAAVTWSLATAAINEYGIVTTLYPAVVAATNAAFAGMIVLRRRAVHEVTKGAAVAVPG